MVTFIQEDSQIFLTLEIRYVFRGVLERALAVEKKGRVSIYVAKGLEALSDMARHEARQAAQRESLVEAITQELRPYLQRSHEPVPRLQVFEGKKAVRGMLFEHQCLWRESMFKRAVPWVGMQDHTFLDHYSDWVEQYWKSASMKPDFKMERLRLFSNGTQIEESIQKRLGAKAAGKRQLRSFPDGRTFNSTLWVIGDFIITIRSRSDPHFAVQMLDEPLAANLLVVFESLWGYKFRG